MIDFIAESLLLTSVFGMVLGFIFKEDDYKTWSKYCFVLGVILYLFGFYLAVLIIALCCLYKYFDAR